MQETWHCPICGDLMTGIKRHKKFLFYTGKISNYSERTCNGLNHSLQIYVDEETNEVDLLKVSLLPDYSRFIFVDFYNKRSRVVCLKNNMEEEIKIPKLIEPDFPDLKKLKSKVNLFIVFL